MMALKRSECAILSLVLKRKWFELIYASKKRQEYRACTKYWRVRLDNWARAVSATVPPIVEFRRGYGKNAPRMAWWVYGLETSSGLRPYGATSGAGHPEWGEPEGQHFVIQLGGRVNLLHESEVSK